MQEKKTIKDTRKQITLRLPDDLYKSIKQEAEQLGISMKALLILIINSYCFSQGIHELPQVFLLKEA